MCQTQWLKLLEMRLRLITDKKGRPSKVQRNVVKITFLYVKGIKHNKFTIKSMSCFLCPKYIMTFLHSIFDFTQYVILQLSPESD